MFSIELLGSRVVVQDEKTREKEVYHLVFGDAVEYQEGHVTMSSPIGRALLGKVVGDEIVLRLPEVTRRVKLVELQTIHHDASA